MNIFKFIQDDNRQRYFAGDSETDVRYCKTIKRKED
jgi:hypothetical protein